MGRNDEDVSRAYVAALRSIQLRDNPVFNNMVEQGMRDAKNIYDFNDFKEVVVSKGNCEVLEQFIDFPNGSFTSIKAKQNLNYEMVRSYSSVEARHIFWKEKYNQTDFFQCHS